MARRPIHSAAGLLIALAALALAVPPGAARGDIVPFVDCVAPNPATGTWWVYYGYTNDGPPQTIDDLSQNQMLPGFQFQGQPTVFNTGTYYRVVRQVWNQFVFNAVAWDLNGHQAIAFRTPVLPAPDPVPDVGFCIAGETGPVTDVTPTSAKLGAIVGTVGEPTSYNFEYGTGPGPLTALPPAVAGPGRATLVTASVSGLQPNTLYRYRVIATNSDGTTTGEEKTFTTPPAPVPSIDLSIAQSLTPDSVTAPGALTAMLTAKNLDGANTATDVQVTDILPPGTTFDASASSPDCTGAADVVTCAIGDLGPGQEVSRTVAFAAAAPGLRTNTARVTGTQPDPVSANDLAVASANVVAPPPPVEPPPPPVQPPPPIAPPPGPTTFKLVARASSSGAAIREGRGCPLGVSAAVALDSDAAGRATLIATTGRTAVASRIVTLGRGRTTSVLCLSSAGRKLVTKQGRRFKWLAATVKATGRSGALTGTASVSVRFRKR